MWYFTKEGLQEAAQTVRWSDENETLAITQAVEGNIAIRAANSLHASKNAKLDHQLSFMDYMYAKNWLLIAIENAKWGNKAVYAFNWFFHNLDNHPLWDEGVHGEHTLLLYASHVQQDWHDKLTQKKAYNIGTINEDLLAKIEHELDSRDIKSGLDQVHSFPCLPTDQETYQPTCCYHHWMTMHTSPTTKPACNLAMIDTCCCCHDGSPPPCYCLWMLLLPLALMPFTRPMFMLPQSCPYCCCLG
ncbi:hypothetical protein ID866_12497 [Astraeus odoratus]|nr:hypothetical protein ID866_12497 [Astraeus odoratus]